MTTATVPWERALVTGASSGVGEHIARQLAEAGTDLVLVARREERLRELADELHAATNATVDVLAADLARRDQLDLVAERCADRDHPVDLLVNNAGLGTNGDFVEAALETQQQQLDVNVVALMRLTHAVLPVMVERRRGAVMNISSLASFQPGPSSAIYAATKAFVTSFSEAIYEELKGSGVTVTAVCPGFTRTEFHAVAEMEDAAGTIPDPLWMSGEAVARIAIADTAKGKPISVPGLPNRVVASLVNVTPRWIKRRAVGALADRMEPGAT